MILRKKPTPDELTSLRAFNDSPQPILSVYISNWSKKPPTTSELVGTARSLFTSRLRPEEKRLFSARIAQIIDYLKELDTRNLKGVAFFAGGNNQLWRILPLDFTVPSLCLVSHSPYLQPFDLRLKKVGPLAVVLFDSKRAEFMLLEKGRLTHFQHFVDHIVPRKMRAKKEWIGREDKITKKMKEKMRQHLTAIANQLERFLKQAKTHKVIIGGHRETFNGFRRTISSISNIDILATVPTDMRRGIQESAFRCLAAVNLENIPAKGAYVYRRH